MEGGAPFTRKEPKTQNRTCTVTDKVLGYNMVQEMMAYLLPKKTLLDIDIDMNNIYIPLISTEYCYGYIPLEYATISIFV